MLFTTTTRRAAHTVSFLVIIGAAAGGCSFSSEAAPVSTTEVAQRDVTEQVWRDAAAGISVAVPAGWRISKRNTTFVSNPVQRFEMWRGPRPKLNEPFARAQTNIKLMELVPPLYRRQFLVGTPPRPRPFHVVMLSESDNNWTRGRTTYFKEKERIFYFGYQSGRPLTQRDRTLVERVFASIGVEPR